MALDDCDRKALTLTVFPVCCPQVSDPFLLPQLSRKPAGVRHYQSRLLWPYQGLAHRGLRTRAAEQGSVCPGWTKERPRCSGREGGESRRGRETGRAAGDAVPRGLRQDGPQREGVFRAPGSSGVPGSVERGGGASGRLGRSEVCCPTGAAAAKSQSGHGQQNHQQQQEVLWVNWGGTLTFKWWPSAHTPIWNAFAPFVVRIQA